MSNAADTIRHVRRKFGEEARSNLEQAEVLEIRRKYAEGVRMSLLAPEYGVTGPNISNIVHRRSWKHSPVSPVPPPAL